MITDIAIKNYKSITSLELPLTRVNVFIGENGAGKSNFLEALVLVGAAYANKLDNEFLASRGIRVTQPQHMRSAFPGAEPSLPIEITVSGNGEIGDFELTNSNEPYSKWKAFPRKSTSLSLSLPDGLKQTLKEFRDSVRENRHDQESANEVLGEFFKSVLGGLSGGGAEVKATPKSKKKVAGKPGVTSHITITGQEGVAEAFLAALMKQTPLAKELKDFVIYSPENSALRTLQAEGQIEPLGINGEGLLRLLSVLADDENADTLNEIKSSLKVLGWFEDFSLADDVLPGAKRLELKDRYLAPGLQGFDQVSTNEGFLFLLFYFVLFSSDLTPNVFAVDNIDASLNPKLCEKLLKTLTGLAKKHGKQVFLTSHNPAILDGLNLDDSEQALFVVSRGRMGNTKIKQVKKPVNKEGAAPVRLSEMFIKGVLGGLPKGF